MNKEEMLAKLAKLDFPKEEYWIVAGGAMLLYGLRQQTRDIDLGCTKPFADRLEEQGCLVCVQEDGRRRFLVDGDVEISEGWLFGEVITLEGFPVISLKGLLEMKQFLGREKDQSDILAIRRMLDSVGEIRKAGPGDIKTLARLACMLWPDHGEADMRLDLLRIMEQKDAAFFLAGEVGFAQCQLRHDYVEGTASSPVGYLEGIYVDEGFRNLGVARKLLSACQDWARAVGCREFSSDCELSNTQSLHFHLSMGFSEANRIVCFTKKL